MEKKRYRRVNEVFEGALGKHSDESRERYLDEACGDDAELRREVEKLLRADERAQSFLATLPDAVVELRRRRTPARIGKYEILEKIGQGGFGEVYRGRDTVIKRQVAVKTLMTDDEAVRRRFFREAEIAGRLDHPNVTTVHDSGLDGDLPYLVQEYLSGEDLTQRIRRRAPVAPRERVRQLVEIARGLQYAHARGVVHRDVKPSNIRILADGRVKIMDFGIAKLASATRLTQTGAAMGTIAYMAPEQLRGERVDHRADVFAFGVVAYELLSYTPPFEGDSGPAMVYQILETEPPPLGEVWPGCPPRLAALVARCLEKDAGERFPDMTALLDELVAIEIPDDLEAATVPSDLTDKTKALASTTFRERAARWRRASGRLRLALAAAVLAVLAAVAVQVDVDRGREVEPVIDVPPPAAPGELVVLAEPWAEVVAVTAADGTSHDPPRQSYTPFAAELPAGTYRVTLRHLHHGERTCEVEVVAGASAACREELESVDAREFFRREGW